MRRLHKKSGSAMIVVALTASAIGIAVVAGVALSGAISRSQSKQERSVLLRYVTQGAAELAASDLASGRLELGSSKTYYIGGIGVTVSASDNSADLADTALLTINGTTASNAITATRTVAYMPRPLSNIWSYGLYSNGGFTWQTGSIVRGSVYFRNSLSLLGTGTVTKDFKTSSSFNPLGLLSIAGAILTGISPLTFPTMTNSTYIAAADTVLTGDRVLNGYTFPGPNALVVVNGDLTLRGNITGQGTIYVTGSVTIDGNVNLQSSKKLVVITPNGITFDSSGTTQTVAGYFFARGTATLTDRVTLTGAIVANSFSVGSRFDVTWDPWLTQNAVNGVTMKAPQMWP